MKTIFDHGPNIWFGCFFTQPHIVLLLNSKSEDGTRWAWHESIWRKSDWQGCCFDWVENINSRLCTILKSKKHIRSTFNGTDRITQTQHGCGKFRMLSATLLYKFGPMQFAPCSGDTSPVVFLPTNGIYRNSCRDTGPWHEQTTWTIIDLQR